MQMICIHSLVLESAVLCMFRLSTLTLVSVKPSKLRPARAPGRRSSSQRQKVDVRLRLLSMETLVDRKGDVQKSTNYSCLVGLLVKVRREVQKDPTGLESKMEAIVVWHIDCTDCTICRPAASKYWKSRHRRLVEPAQLSGWWIVMNPMWGISLKWVNRLSFTTIYVTWRSSLTVDAQATMLLHIYFQSVYFIRNFKKKLARSDRLAP